MVLSLQVYPPYPLVRRISTASHLPLRIPYHVKRTKFNGGIMKPRPKTKKIKRMELARKILQQFYKVRLIIIIITNYIYSDIFTGSSEVLIFSNPFKKNL